LHPAPRDNPQGESVPPLNSPKEHASTPLLAWTSWEVAREPGLILGSLFRTPGLPSMRIPIDQGPAGVKHMEVCFGFITDSSSGDHTGCCGAFRSRWHGIIRCDRLHLDLAKSEYAQKSVLKPLWDFINHSAVKEYYVPSSAFAELMQQ
jgi:hypothetical protein